MTPGHAVCLIVAIGTIVCFGLAIPFYFQRGLQPTAEKRWLFVALLACAAFQVYGWIVADEASWVWRGIGLAFFGLAHVLFWSAIASHGRRPPRVAFTADMPLGLTSAGPYARIRHPFYSAYTLAWIGGAAVAADIVQLLPAIIMFAFYLRAAIVEERSFMQSPLAGEYERYRRRTGMFIPRLFSANSPDR